MNWDLLVPFTLAVAGFGFLPGPAIFYVVARTLAGGQRAGLMASLGLHFGGYVHVIAAAAGLSIVLEAVPTAYVVLKFLGAAYLIYLGIGMIRTRIEGDSLTLPRAPARTSFWQSAMVEALNPKAALFYLAFLPQFTTLEGGYSVGVQLFILAFLVNLTFSIADISYVFAAGNVQKRLSAFGKTSLWAQRIGGGVLVALGLNLGLSKV